MEKHRRVKQNVETALRNTKNDVAGRLLAKKKWKLFSLKKNALKGSSVHDPKANLKRNKSNFFFRHPTITSF